MTGQEGRWGPSVPGHRESLTTDVILFLLLLQGLDSVGWDAFLDTAPSPPSTGRVLTLFSWCKSAGGASSGARTYMLTAFTITEVFISQPEKSRVCTHFLQQRWGIETSLVYAGSQEKIQPIFFPVISRAVQAVYLLLLLLPLVTQIVHQHPTPAGQELTSHCSIFHTNCYIYGLPLLAKISC